MDVAVSDLRANLSEWLKRVREGTEVVITERGVPVARIIPVEASALLERLTAEGVISRAASPARPAADRQTRPRLRRPVAPLVGEQRR